MVNFIDVLPYIVVAVIVLIIASLNKNNGIRSNPVEKSIIDVTPIHIDTTPHV
ncbi:MAG: hypothetical protein SCH70_07215 [Candidatus Methanoperedens sp.]|nr:hypothetical protein [Candidatus Methanoperedens sp.]